MLSCLSWAEYCALPTHIPKLPHNSVASDPNYILTSEGYQNGYPCRICSVVCEWSPQRGVPSQPLGRRFEPATPQWSSAFLPPSRIAPTGFELAPSWVYPLPQRHLVPVGANSARGNQDERSWPWAAHMGSERISLRLQPLFSSSSHMTPRSITTFTEH